jgi:predicted DNA binding CopG/RHH family protein
MKQPNLRHLKIDRQGTELIRTAFRKKGRGTITLNLDAADLCAAKTRPKKAGIPYQRLVKTLLSTTMSQQESIPSRLTRLEQELRKLKRHAAA